MSRPDYTSIAAYIAHEANTADPERALEMLRVLVDRLAAKGLTLEGVVNDALNPSRRWGRLPTERMSNENKREWIAYMFARRDELVEKDVGHLRWCFNQSGFLKKWQMRWLWDILARVEPGGCGSWGAPE